MKKLSSYVSWMYILLILIFLVGPLAALGVYSFSTEWIGLLPGSFTTEYYLSLIHI